MFQLSGFYCRQVQPLLSNPLVPAEEKTLIGFWGVPLGSLKGSIRFFNIGAVIIKGSTRFFNIGAVIIRTGFLYRGLRVYRGYYKGC